MDTHKYTDKELLDFLQEQTELSQYTGRVIFRTSIYGRGWRLHETSRESAVPDVRDAIARAINMVETVNPAE
ncbi:hypothetical protein LCGC14_1499600 [marine sediment metagenome]|uniref:Uncharacterized protein n=1 Tax=marine sediment metagenome TaxID=412755 RepID=A0A0F9LK46_9ZZZZ